MVAMSDAGRIGVFGRSGSGKSTLVKKLIAKRKRVIIFDPQDEYKEVKGVFTVRRIDDVRAYIARNWRKSFKVAYVPPANNEMEALDRLSKLAKLAQIRFFEGVDNRQLTLVVEEMHECFPVTTMPKNLSGFGTLCSKGRHYGVELIGASQRIAEVNKRFRGNCSELYILPQQDYVDIKLAAKQLGFVKPEEVQALQPHNFMLRKDGKVTRGKN
ncbi:helicase HerA domain-containing protein [Thalassospira marina]|uniref:Uncharacterized protein n=1 Tax=Thalassospira marina TaxID=2048283 RepID=A0A2N3KTL6_9PROT|nr:DUF87 domain-containing protein [Thalassospira marina]AUG55724.1 hypothetical protein CSC3H3_23030 [Thalassospira marina]PKR53881.1 hypothetical protein COO20_12810 [Thalassospira marina]